MVSTGNGVTRKKLETVSLVCSGFSILFSALWGRPQSGQERGGVVGTREQQQTAIALQAQTISKNVNVFSNF